MIPYKFRTLLLLCMLAAICQQVDGQVRAREALLGRLRAFRDTLNTHPESAPLDSLADNTSTMIIIAEKLKDTSDIGAIDRYFRRAQKALHPNLTPDEMGQITENLNNDLSLKLSGFTNVGLGHLESSGWFSRMQDVRILVKINGLPLANRPHRLYWATFTGKNQQSLIKAGAWEGKSNSLSEPYSLKIELPGFITFWLSDETNQSVYRSSDDHFILSADQPPVEVNFIPL